MNEVTLPPSPNWYLSNILACASDGTVAWGAKNCIVIAEASDDNKKLNYKIIDKAHTERVTSVVFSPVNKTDNDLSLVSCADDHVVKVWNVSDLSLKLKNSQLANDQKVIGVDWSKHNPNLICFVSQEGILVTWDIKHNISQQINISKLPGINKLTTTCIACCPHDSNLVAIGTKTGLICVVDIRASGKASHKYHRLRGHDKEIVSLSWCPVPINVFQEKETKEFLLASGAKDREIYLWKAGTDCRYELKLTLSNTPLDLGQHKSKVSGSAGNFTAVCWLEPTTLLTSSPWGELLVWDLSGFDAKKKFTSKLVHAAHGKGLFSIAGISEKPVGENGTSEDDNWRIKNNIKAIWTMSQDRQVICSSLVHGETVIEYKIPTIGGFVYCMSACTVDTSQIAFGVGDNMIRLWNLSEPHEKSIDLQLLWEKIMGKVRALAWHSEKENLLAFATDEGRIGVCDTNVKKPPILYRPYHRHTVYRIGWGPAPNLKEHALYSCADFEVVYYTPGKTEDNPTSVVKKDCTEFGWKPDYSLLALGFQDGSISFLKSDLSETGEKIRILDKPIQCLAWHPESTASDMNFSPMQNYLAVATTQNTITIFEVSSKEDNENESSQLVYKLVATLNGHNDKVVCLAWSPHISGYLVSGAYDYSAQVWKVETQEIIASFIGHLAPLQCCMWSPFSQDLILTGSADFTLQMWSISKQSISTSPRVTKTSTKGKRTKKKKVKDSTMNDANSETGSVAKDTNKRQSIDEELTKLSLNENDDILRGGKKKKRKITYFPKYAEINKDNDMWCDTVKNLLEVVEHDNRNGETGTADSNAMDCSPIEEDKASRPDKAFLFLGSKKNLEEVLEHEKNLLETIGHHNIATEIDLWRGNLKENLENALKNKRLSDFAVSLAPSVSIEFWKEVCEGYAAQLNSEEHYQKAVSYLLCLNKVNEAINIFVNANMYKEAYALASSKLDSEDPIVKNILVEWANSAQKDGHFQNASECYIKLKDYAKAAKVLERRKDLKSLLLAIDVAERSNDNGLMTSIADKAILEALVISDIETAKSIVKKCPTLRYREVEIEIFDELNKLFNNFGDEAIFKWLKGSLNINLLEDIKTRFASNPTHYSLLLQKDVFLVILSEKMLQVSVSHQLALSVLAEQEVALSHIVTALDIILNYEKTDCAIVENKLPFSIKYFSVFDTKKNIIDNYQNELGKSLRGYLCRAVIDWYLKDNILEEQKSECADLTVEMIEVSIVNLLDREAVKFWTLANQIKSLEMKLTEVVGTIPNGGDLNDTQPLIEQLDQLRNERAQFVQQRVSAPNPLLSYSIVMEFINKIPNESVRFNTNELVMEIWQRAIS